LTVSINGFRSANILARAVKTGSSGSLRRRRNVKIAGIPPLDVNVANRVKIMIGGSLRKRKKNRAGIVTFLITLGLMNPARHVMQIISNGSLRR
jgi:hypothetical protein